MTMTYKIITDIMANQDILAVYLFGSLTNEDDKHWFEVYSYELEEFAAYVAKAYMELRTHKQLPLNIDNAEMIINYEAIGFTRRPHIQGNRNALRKWLGELINQIA